MQVTNNKNTYQKFDSWDKGVQAQLDHLALYAGANGYPKDDTYDPINVATIKGKATTINSLDGKWTSSATYGDDVNKLYKDLLDFSGVDYSKDTDNNSNSTQVTFSYKSRKT